MNNRCMTEHQYRKCLGGYCGACNDPFKQVVLFKIPAVHAACNFIFILRYPDKSASNRTSAFTHLFVLRDRWSGIE